MENSASATEVRIQPSLQLMDVYLIAEKVGEQFEQLIKQFGSTHMESVVTIVVDSLEHLERFVEEKQRLEINNRKLLLQVDSLAHEKKERIRLSDKVDELHCLLKAENDDKKRLAARIDRLMIRNEDLSKQLERAKGTSLKPVPLGQDPLNEDKEPPQRSKSVHTMPNESSLDLYPNGSLVAAEGPDRLQFPRMSKRLSQVELELQKTRRKLVEAHHNLQTTSAENRGLKAQLDESKAEAALNSFERSKSDSDGEKYSRNGPPKFYKQDLLAVLKERNELKEELEAAKEDLKTAKRELKQLQGLSQQVNSNSSLPSYMVARPRSTTRVREILDSITESLSLADQQPENT